MYEKTLRNEQIKRIICFREEREVIRRDFVPSFIDAFFNGRRTRMSLFVVVILVLKNLLQIHILFNNCQIE